MPGCLAGATAGWRLAAARRPAGVAILAALTLALVAGCGGSAPKSATTTPSSRRVATTASRPCGTTRTAANVPVRIHIERGSIGCHTAMDIERGYATAIRAGQAPGNGGGGPVHVRGWTCEGFPTPKVLATGQASRCIRGDNEILAILPAPA